MLSSQKTGQKSLLGSISNKNQKYNPLEFNSQQKTGGIHCLIELGQNSYEMNLLFGRNF